MLRKCICMIVTVALVVCVSVAPVGAIDAEGTFDCLFSLGNINQHISIPRAGNKVSVGSWLFSNWDGSSSFSLGLRSADYVLPESGVVPSGDIGVYFSFAVAVDVPVTYSYTQMSNYKYSYTIANTSSFTAPATVNRFNFSTGVSGLFPSEGIQLSARLDDIDSLVDFRFFLPSNGIFLSFDSYPVSFTANYYVPSASIVYTEVSGGLDALESVADQIAEGNEIARAMYGDIMAALSALKGDTALMASYINDCLAYLSSIETASVGIYNLCASYLHNLASIAQTAEDIEAELEAFHTDFMSKLNLLISTITSESDDIQATMDRIYEQLIAWLETNFKEAISPEFEGSNSDLSQGIQNNDAIEQQWTGSLSDTWSAMHISDFSFDPSFTSGFMWVSGWFSNIYNSLGLYGSIIILPLIIGICKLLLGYFRFSGHGHSRGGDADA